MILITGAAGKTGRAIISALAAKGEPVRAFVHSEEQRDLVELSGANEVVVGDMRSENTFRHAAQAIETIYHICPNVNPDEIAIGKNAMMAGRIANIKHFVFHSVLHPQVEAMPHHWHKLRVEEALLESQLPFTILQPAAYMQNILGEWQAIIQRGVCSVPYSVQAPFSLVDLEDVAEAAATVICEPGHAGASYELCGPEILTPSQMTLILSKQTGRQVRTEQISIDAWKHRAQTLGLGAYQIKTLVRMFNYYDRYGLWGNPRVLENLIGRPATKFEAFVERTLRERTAG